MAQPVGDIALIGLAVMGQNIILNMNDHGFTVVAFNRTVSKVDDFLANEAKGTNIVGAHSMEEMVAKLKKPRRVMLLVKAGAAVDAFIDKLVPLLEAGDIIIDGGNSEYKDTNRRCRDLGSKGIHYVGSGVSGGEEGAGHFVKMVHNGIEYGDMQVICEAYHLMKNNLGMSPPEIGKVIEGWNKTELDSYLIEISANILQYQDEQGEYLVEKIRDTAGQKGTGKWTAINALDYGVPVTLIAESVFARCLSAIKDERVVASKSLLGPQTSKYAGDKNAFIEDIRQALYASKIVSYALGFMLMREAAKEFGWP